MDALWRAVTLEALYRMDSPMHREVAPGSVSYTRDGVTVEFPIPGSPRRPMDRVTWFVLKRCEFEERRRAASLPPSTGRAS